MKNLKRKLLPISFLALGIGALAGCGNNNPTPEPSPTPTPDPWYVLSEKAMTNFFDKLNQSSYTVHGDELNGLTTAVHDQNTVTWFFKEGSRYNDHFCVTVDYESYYGLIDYTKPEGQQLVEMTFMDKDSAVNVSESVLPTYWASKDICGGNIWSLFHNSDPEHPLRYTVSKNLNFNDTVCAMCDFGGFESPDMADFVLEFDQVDVTLATLNFTYIPSGAHQRINGSMSIEFGKEVRTSDIVTAWVNNPARPYPAPVGGHSDWPSQFSGAVRNVYAANLLLDAKLALPYDNFFSYATNFNSKTYIYDNFVQVHDFHATQEGAEQYMQTLLSKGFTQAVGPSGTVFRSPVLRTRGEYKLYADVTLTFKPDDGLVIKTEPYYTHTSYGTRDLVNAHIQGAQGGEKFPVFPDSSAITRFYGEDEQFHGYEDRVGFYDYDLFMFVHLEYKDATAMDDYLNSYYEELLQRGFVYNKSYQEYSKSDIESTSVVRFEENANGKVTFLFYNQKHVAPNEAVANIDADGFPKYEDSLSIDSIQSINDLKGYFKIIDGLDLKYYYSMDTDYDSYAEVKQRADDYGAALVAAGFAKKSSSLRTVRYEKNNGSLVCEMDYDIRNQQGTYLNLWFSAK